MSSATAKLASQQASSRRQADFALGFVALIWGVTFVLVKRALTEISTLYFLALRFSLAAACLLILFAGAFRRMKRREILQGLRGGAVAGVFLCLGYVLQSFGLRYTTAGKSGFLTGFSIVLVPAIGTVLFRRRPQLIEVLGILAATAGIALLTVPSIEGGIHINRGDLLTIGCAAAFSFHLLILGYYSQREAFEALAFGQIAATALFCWMTLPFDPPRVVWSGAVVAAIVITAVFATAVAFSVQTWAQARTTPNRTALLFALEPVFALVTAVWLGGESLALPGIVGSALILSGILAVELKPAARA